MRAFCSDLAGEDRAKTMNSEPHIVMTDDNGPVMQKVFDISKREWKPNKHHHRKKDNLG